MKVLLAEYAMGIGLKGTLLLEGKAMLGTLAESFSRLGHDVTYLSAGSKLENGNAIICEERNFRKILETAARKNDAGLVVGPDELLGDLTEIIERNTVNLGCSPESIRSCADKLMCTCTLQSNSIDVPQIIECGYNGRYVLKPRFGCASEGVRMISGSLKTTEDNYIATEYIEGEHLSVSMICGQRTLHLSLNRQLIHVKDEDEGTIFDYRGNQVPYTTEYDDEVLMTAKRSAEALGCSGYVGIDIVYGDRPYVIDVNPRPTTALFGLVKTLRCEIGELLLNNVFGTLPDSVDHEGECSFTKNDIEDIIWE